MPLGAARFGLLGGAVDLASLELIETITASGTATIDFTSIQESTFSTHILTAQNAQSSATNDLAGIRFYESGVLETASVYRYSLQLQTNDPSTTQVRSTGDSNIRFFGGYSTTFGGTGNAIMFLHNLGNSATYSMTTSDSVYITNGNDISSHYGSGLLPQTSTVDGIRIFNSLASGNFDEGVFSLYGVKT